MGFSKYLRLFMALGVVTAALGGCSSDSASAGPAPASYSGKTTEATVTSDNSKDIGNSSIDGAGAGLSFGSLAASGQNSNKAQLLGLASNMHSRMMELDVSSTGNSQTSLAAVNTYNNTVTSNCGGSYSYSYTLDSVTYAYSGTYTYNGYVDCKDKGTTSGTVTYSGTYNLSGAYFPTLKYEFTALTYTYDNESMTMTGSFDLTMTSLLNYSFTMNMDFRDNIKNVTFKLENYVAAVVEDASKTFADIQLSGKIYHSVHGFVAVSTTTALRAYAADDYPTSGVMKLVGTSNSAVIVTFTSNDTYTLQIDSNGDATYETTKSCTWSTDTCS